MRAFRARNKVTIQDGGRFQGEAGTSTYFTPRKGESSDKEFPKKCGIYGDNYLRGREGKGKESIVIVDG